jgi:LETM1-like protein
LVEAWPHKINIVSCFFQTQISGLNDSPTDRSLRASSLTARAMRSSFPCGACISRSSQCILQGRVRLRANTYSHYSIHPISARPVKHLATSATRNAETGQKSTHASVAISTPHEPSSTTSTQGPLATPEHLEPTLPHPRNDLSSTRPAPLELPESPSKEGDGSITLKSRGSYFYRLGKAYLGFYKLGIKNIWSNFKEYGEIKKKVRGTDIDSLVKYASAPEISRREFQLYLRTKHDLKKLLPFGLVFLVCGEFTPLVILALGTAVVPYTCRIPKQVQKDLQKTLSHIEDVKRITNQADASPVKLHPSLAYIHGLDPFGLSLHKTPLLGPLLWRTWIAPRLKQHIDNILCDALLIAKEGGADRLEPEELFQFCIAIRKPEAINRLIERYTSGTQSKIPTRELTRTQNEVQAFIDAVTSRMAPHQEQEKPASDPQDIFVSAAKYVHAAGLEGPYLPPQPRRPDDTSNNVRRSKHIRRQVTRT